ncbi:MAG: alpha/beta fold hydrolase [Gemmatimonadota bacterium]|nr:alpha/beta fold hydrolase [Gemmatimonadota bacterium]
MPRESGFTTTTQVPLYWCAYGAAGATRLLVLHGGPGAHHDYLLPQMLELAGTYELVFYDQRGGGRSKTDDRAPITWRTHVEDLVCVIEELRFSDQLSLVGYSWGGLLALLYAVETSARPWQPLRRLVLIDPAPVDREHRAAFEREMARRQAAPEIQRMREELASSGMRERDPEAYRHRVFELSVAGYFAHPERARDLTPFRVMGRVQQSVWDSLGDYDLTPQLGAVGVPTLIVHGRQDPIPVASSELIARAIPQSSLVLLEDCGHVPYVEQPVALFTAVKEFLAATNPTTLS